MPLVGLGLGANLGAPQQQLVQGLRAIARDVGRVERVSSLWRTPPWGVVDQPPFLNACALVETSLVPLRLLDTLKAIEREVGRMPGRRWGPRLLDLDILFYDDVLLETPRLTVPHKSMFERAFVLAPLAEIVGDRLVAGRRIDVALAALDASGLEKVDTLHWPVARGGDETDG